MRNKNRLVAPVIEKTVYESSDNHNEVDNKKQQTSNLIQKITSIIFCIISFGYGIGERGSEIQIEIVKHIIMNSNTKFCCMEFTYTNISKICFSTTFSFTSITYLQENNEATEAPTQNIGINKKFLSLELHLQIHVEHGTYADTLTYLLQIIIEQLPHLIIIFYYKQSNIPKTLKKTIPQWLFLLIKIHHHLYHHVLFFRTTLGNHQCECYQSIVSNTLSTVLTIENTVLFHKPKEQHSSNTFVTITKRMVLHNQIQQHGGFFFYGRIKVFTCKGLIDLPDAALEGVIFFISKPLATSELFFQGIDG